MSRSTLAVAVSVAAVHASVEAEKAAGGVVAAAADAAGSLREQAVEELNDDLRLAAAAHVGGQPLAAQTDAAAVFAAAYAERPAF